MMPFDGGIDSLSNGTLLFSLAASGFYLLVQGRPPSWRRTVAKTAATALLAVLAAIEGGPALLVAALALSALGDAFLAHDGDRALGDKAFMGGLASFLLAHLAYAALFVSVGGGLEIVLAQIWRAGLVLVVAVLAGILLRYLLPAAGPALRLPVAVYAAAIMAMMLAAATVPAPLVLIGAALFVTSDALLAIERFLTPPGPQRGSARTGAQIWVFYYLAQLAITLGFVL